MQSAPISEGSQLRTVEEVRQVFGEGFILTVEEDLGDLTKEELVAVATFIGVANASGLSERGLTAAIERAIEENESREFVKFGRDPRVVFTAGREIMIRFSKPIMIGPTGELSQWGTFREPTIDQMLVMEKQKGDLNKLLAFVTMALQAPGAEVRKLSASDFSLLNNVLGNFS